MRLIALHFQRLRSRKVKKRLVLGFCDPQEPLLSAGATFQE